MFSFGFNVKPRKASGVSYDADAQAFFTAASITDTTQKNAVNQLVLDLKNYGVWTKCLAIYPIVGGSASSHKFNLKNPQDTDAAFRLTFSTGYNHSSTGMTPNGTSAFTDTFITPSLVLTNNNTHFSIYSRTNSIVNNSDIGAVSGTGIINIHTRYSDGNLYADQYNFITNRITISNSNSTGFYVSTRTSSNVFKLFKNNAQFGTTNTNASTPNITTISSKIYLSALNSSGTPVNYSNRELAFASIGDGLTDTEAADFYTAVQAYQTTLSRNV